MADEFTHNPDAASHEEPAPQPASTVEGVHDQIKQAATDLKAAATAKVDDFKTIAAVKAEELKAAATAKVDDLRAAASLKAEELRGVASAKADEYRAVASEKAEEYRAKAEAAYADAKGRARVYQNDGEEYVRQNPTRAVIGAVVAGFFLGLLLRK